MPVGRKISRLSGRCGLTRRQLEKMATRPDMILQFAHHLDRVWQEQHRVLNPLVTAQAECSLNFRSPADLIDPERDLSAVPRSLQPADWILPLDPALMPGHLVQQDLP